MNEGEEIRVRKLAEHTARIRKDIAAIKKAGLTVDRHVCSDVLDFLAGKLPKDKVRSAVQ